jgi:hypothetical protein
MSDCLWFRSKSHFFDAFLEHRGPGAVNLSISIGRWSTHVGRNDRCARTDLTWSSDFFSSR